MGFIDDLDSELTIKSAEAALRKAYEGIAKSRAKVAAKHYGIDEGLVLSKLLGNCEICGFRPVNHKSILVIDHNHDSGAFRGALCSNCNTGLGFMRDSVAVLSNAIEYLKERGSYGSSQLKNE